MRPKVRLREPARSLEQLREGLLVRRSRRLERGTRRANRWLLVDAIVIGDRQISI